MTQCALVQFKYCFIVFSWYYNEIYHYYKTWRLRAKAGNGAKSTGQANRGRLTKLARWQTEWRNAAHLCEGL